MHDFFDQLTKFAQVAGAQQALAFLTAAGAVMVSLLTAILAPVISVYVARRQIRATVVSANRQKWIDNLRDALAEFSSLHLVAFFTKKLQDTDISTKIFNLQNKILLLTNPNELDHVQLNQLIAQMVDASPNDPKVDLWKLQRELVALARRILKTEWIRVRGGK